MSEDVKIRLKFEQEGANAFAETKAKIEQLYKAAAAYEGKGMDTAAKSARSEAKSLEKDLARDAKERISSEKAISRETKQRATEEKAHSREQAAVDKARMSMFQRATRHAAGAVESGAGGSPMGSLAGMLGGPVGIGLQIAAAVTAVAGAFARQKREEAIIGMEDKEARTMENFDTQRMAGVDGSAAGARGEAISARRDRLQRLSAVPRLNEEAEVHADDVGSWWRWLTGSAKNALRRNQNAIDLDRKTEKDENKNSEDHFAREGRKQIEIDEMRAKGHMAAAKAAEMALQYHRKVEEIQRQLPDTEEGRKEAIRGADAHFAGEMRGREQAMAGLINARTGAGAAARIASLASHQFQQARDSVLAQKMDDQRRLHLDTHQQAMNVATRGQFFSPPLHP